MDTYLPSRVAEEDKSRHTKHDQNDPVNSCNLNLKKKFFCFFFFCALPPGCPEKLFFFMPAYMYSILVMHGEGNARHEVLLVGLWNLAGRTIQLKRPEKLNVV